MSRRSSEALRLRMADEAARFMGEHGMRDYRLAKEKAAQQLNVRQRSAWPSNLEIDTALRERQSLFGGDAHRLLQTRMRREALQAMRVLKDYSPALVGPVLEGVAAPGVPVQLHVCAEEPEHVEMCLDSAGLVCEMAEKRFRCADRSYRYLPCLKLRTGDVSFEIVVFSRTDFGNPPLSPLTGKPFRRGSITDVARACEQAA